MSRPVTHRTGPPRGALAGLAALALMAAAAPAASAPARTTPLVTALAALDLVPAPTKPVITVAPASLTNVATPTFTWTGNSQSYKWEVVDAAGTTVETLTGPETTVTLSTPLGDGAYTFSVAPAPTPAPVPGVPRPDHVASHRFTLDTIAPPVPRITSRPPFPTTITTPAFSVADLEAGAAATWSVIASGGTLAQGPAPVANPAITLGALAVGSYVFQVRQTDAAGNASAPANEPFAIIAPPAPPPPPAVKPTRLVLPKMNTKRLTPRVGASLRTVRPVLTWSRGPKGTTLYNVQVFRVGANTTTQNATVQLTKLRSVFPRARQVRLRGLKRGQCYVWRVWPYIGSKFTVKPLGVSNFCIAAAPKRRARTA